MPAASCTLGGISLTRSNSQSSSMCTWYPTRSPFLADLVHIIRLSDPAKSAYENALDILKKTVTVDEYSTPWLQRQSSMRDVQDAVVRAMEEYKTKSKGNKVQGWLSSCSERVMYYGGRHLRKAHDGQSIWLTS